MANGSARPNFAKARFALWAGVIGCLIIPFVAMQITDEVNWTAFDFLAAAVILFAAGSALELVLRSKISRRSRMIVGAAIAAAVAVIWAQGAVGVI